MVLDEEVVEDVVEDVVVIVVGVSLHAASSIESTSKRDIKEMRFFIRGSFCIALLSLVFSAVIIAERKVYYNRKRQTFLTVCEKNNEKIAKAPKVKYFFRYYCILKMSVL